MRTRSPALRMEPSMRCVARNCCPIPWMSRFWPLNWNAEVRATICKFGTLASAALISSVMPSEKNSWLGSPDKLIKGSTAMEMPADCGAEVEDATFCCAVSPPVDGTS